MLHRDLKPSNVMVVDHRVVVLDFGLVRELDGDALSKTLDGNVNGTPAYMAPEQARGEALSEATDWYAFGVMLYEAMSGVLPCDGPLLELFQQKLERDPTPLDQFVPGLPPHLNELCMALLRRDPRTCQGARDLGGARTAARQRRFDLEPDAPGVDQSNAYAQVGTPLFGRESELDTLDCDGARGRRRAGHRACAGRIRRGQVGVGRDFLEGIDRRRRDVPNRGAKRGRASA